MLEFLKSDTFRRIIAAIVGLALPFMNQKLGLNIPSEQVIAAIVFLAVYIGQSVANTMHARLVAASTAGTAAAKDPGPALNG